MEFETEVDGGDWLPLTHYGTQRLACLLTRLRPVLKIIADVSVDATGQVRD